MFKNQPPAAAIPVAKGPGPKASSTRSLPKPSGINYPPQASSAGSAGSASLAGSAASKATKNFPFSLAKAAAKTALDKQLAAKALRAKAAEALKAKQQKK